MFEWVLNGPLIFYLVWNNFGMDIKLFKMKASPIFQMDYTVFQKDPQKGCIGNEWVKSLH